MDHRSQEQIAELRKLSKLMQAFDHTNVIKVERTFKDKEGHLSLVMEYADGGSLSDQIKERTVQG